MPADGGFHLIAQLACGDVRLDKAGCNAVYAYVIPTQLAGHRFRRAQHTCFSRAVVGPPKIPPPRCADTDEMQTMLPDFCARMVGITAGTSAACRAG